MSKLIGILSDTHSCWDDKFSKYFAGCDEIWHCGDIGDYSIVERLQEIAPVVRAVCGNIDHGMVRRRCSESLIFETEGLKVWLTHIAGYPGKYAPGAAKVIAENNIKLLVCGHSHILKVMPDPKFNLLHINPGAAGHHGWQRERTIIRLTIDQGRPSQLEVITLNPKTPS